MAIEITDEIRHAVLAEMCETSGHIVNTIEAVGFDDNNRPGIRTSDPDKLPHMYCNRCGITWIVIAENGANYDDADTKFRKRLKDDDPQKTRKPKK
jgi:hypothetical protein